MTDNQYGPVTPPSSSNPYPELRYDSAGRPLSGSSSPAGGYGASGGGGTPGLGPYTPGQYSGGTAAAAPYSGDPYGTPTGYPQGATGYQQGTAGYPQGPAGYQPAYGAQTYQQGTDTTLVVVAWIVAVFTGFYMLPWAIAVTRRHDSAVAIALVTLFTGWTGIGWVVGLVWSLTGTTRTSTLPPPGWYPSPTGVGQQFWDGYAWTGHTHP